MMISESVSYSMKQIAHTLSSLKASGSYFTGVSFFNRSYSLMYM